MLKFPVAVEKLESTEEYQQFKEKHKHAYLITGFFMSNSSDLKDMFWQLDYLDDKKQKITSFLMKENIEVKHEQEMLQGGEKVSELKYEDIKVMHLDALEIAKKELKHDKIAKLIVIIQNINQVPTWNVTLILNSFDVFNIRINASNGEILKKKQESILSFRDK